MGTSPRADLAAVAVVVSLGLAGCRPEFLERCVDLAIGPGDQVSCQVPDWTDRGYDLAVPAGWDGTASLPLVIAYHGGGGNRDAAQRVTCPDGNAGEPGCLETLATARGFAVVSPDGTGGRPLRDVRTWNAGGGTPGEYCASGAACARNIDDIGYTEDLLAEVAAAIPVDARRVYATGLSNGGAMSHRIACERPELIAAIAPVGGANQHADDGGACGSTPVLHVHGSLDPCWPFAGGVGECIEKNGRKTSVDETMADWAARNGCTGAPVDVELPDTDPDDGVRAIRRTYAGCAAATELLIMEGGGHTWPDGDSYLSEDRVGKVGRDVDSGVLLDFFEAHVHP